MTHYRFAHALLQLGVPILPRADLRGGPLGHGHRHTPRCRDRRIFQHRPRYGCRDRRNVRHRRPRAALSGRDARRQELQVRRRGQHPPRTAPPDSRRPRGGLFQLFDSGPRADRPQIRSSAATSGRRTDLPPVRGSFRGVRASRLSRTGAVSDPSRCRERRSRRKIFRQAAESENSPSYLPEIAFFRGLCSADQKFEMLPYLNPAQRILPSIRYFSMTRSSSKVRKFTPEPTFRFEVVYIITVPSANAKSI